MSAPASRVPRGAGAATALDFGLALGATLATDAPTLAYPWEDEEGTQGYLTQWWTVMNGSVDLKALVKPPRAFREARLSYEIGGFRQRFRTLAVPNPLLRRLLKEAHAPASGSGAFGALALGACEAEGEYLLCFPGGPDFRDLCMRRVSPAMAANAGDANEAEMFSCAHFEERIEQIVCQQRKVDRNWLVGARTSHDCNIFALADAAGDGVLRKVDTASFGPETACMAMSPFGAEAAVATRDGAVCTWSSSGVTAARTALSSDKSRFWSVAYGSHPRALLVANARAVGLEDLRAPPRRRLLATALGATEGEFTAMARDTDSSFHYATASLAYVSLMDTRMPCQPVLRWRHRRQEDPIAHLQFAHRNGQPPTLLAVHPQQMDVVAYNYTPDSPVHGPAVALPEFLRRGSGARSTGPALPATQPQQIVGFADIVASKEHLPANLRVQMLGFAAAPLAGATPNLALACVTTIGAVYMGNLGHRDSPIPDPPLQDLDDEAEEAAAAEKEIRARARRRHKVVDATEKYHELMDEAKLEAHRRGAAGVSTVDALRMLEAGPVSRAELAAAGVDADALASHEDVTDGGGGVLMLAGWRPVARPTETPRTARLRTRWMATADGQEQQDHPTAALPGVPRGGRMTASSARKAAAPKRPGHNKAKRVGFL